MLGAVVGEVVGADDVDAEVDKFDRLSFIIKAERELWVTGTWQLKLSRVVFPSITWLSKSWAISDTISGAELPKLSQHLHTGVLEQFVIIRADGRKVLQRKEMREWWR